MIIENLPVLNEWLISYLEPICDADPHALAKYIMALIRKDKTENELKKICLEQLEVFLVNETNAFVDKLFVALNDKSYLNGSNNSNSSNNTNKTSNQQNEQTPHQQRPRSPKLHRNVPAPSGSSRRYQNQIPINTSSQSSNKYEKHSRSPSKYSPSRHSPKKRRSRSRSLGKNYKRNRSRSPPSSQQTNHNQQHNVQISDNRHFSNSNSRRCRDYDEKGFCMSGNLCPFMHGQNALVLDTPNANSMLGLASSQANNLNNILLPTPSNQKQAQQQPKSQPPQFTEPYNPEEPEIDKQDYRPSTNDKRNGLTNIYLSNEFNNNDDKFNKKHMNNQSHQNRQINNRPPFRSNNKRNNKPYSNNTTDNSEKTTLMVSKIPSNLNTITNLNEHFSKFGTITNLKIHYENDPESSLVEFSTNSEALAAYRSTEPILNNRFIKVYWHSSGSNASANQTTTKEDKPNENDEANKVEKKQSIKDRLGKIVEKQTSITNTAVTNLLNSGLIGNAPNQLASLMIGTNKLPNVKPSVPVSKPVFDPAKLKKQYTPTTVNSASSNPSVSNSTTSTTGTTMAATFSVTSTADLTTNRPVNTFTSNALMTKPLNTSKSNVSINKHQQQQLNKEKLIKRLELQKKRQEMLSTYIQQNRLLVDKLEKSKTDAEKQSIRETVDSLTKKIKQLEADIKKGNSSIIEETNLQKQQYIIS